MTIYKFPEIMVIALLYAATHKISFQCLLLLECGHEIGMYFMTVHCVVIEKATADFQANCLSYANCSATSCSVTVVGQVPVAPTVKTTELTNMDDQTTN
jgi:hypothetical protein